MPPPVTPPPGIPDEALPVVVDLLAAPLRCTAELRAELTAYAEVIAQAAHDNELLDPDLAHALHEACTQLLDLLDAGNTTDPAAHALIQAAVAYFILDDDAEPDLSSVCGLDDDAAVCNAVARHLGRDDLVIDF